MIDMRFGYHQLMIRAEDIYERALKTQYGQYIFLVKSFGLTNAPAAIMDLINHVFKTLLILFMKHIIYDVIVYSRNRMKHEYYFRIGL